MFEGVGSGGGTYAGAGHLNLFQPAPKKPPYKAAQNIKPASAPAPRSAPAPAPRAAAPRQTISAPFFLGGSAGGGGGGAAVAPPAPPMLSETDYLAGDSSYQAQIAALLKALQDEQADNTAQQSKYNVDYGSALQSLGYTPDNPATTDVNEGAWNFGDLNTAAGRAFQNQQNDFAGRGLLQSSLYGEAQDNLTRSLNDQLSGINTAKQNFFDDLARQGTAFSSENNLSQQQAKAEALARRAAGISL